MDFELKLAAGTASGPWWSALVMGLAYFIGKLHHLSSLLDRLILTTCEVG